jgi:hypothetical protein
MNVRPGAWQVEYLCGVTAQASLKLEVLTGQEAIGQNTLVLWRGIMEG